jgi:hypothetical protein
MDMSLRHHGDGVLFDELIKNAKNYEFNMDVFWVQMGGGDPLAIMKKYPNKFPLASPERPSQRNTWKH